MTFDPSKVSYAELVEFFYRTHDPTQVNAQGNDRGTQYRSAIFAHSPQQLDVIKQVTSEVQEKHFTPKGKKIVTQIEERPAGDFFEADEYHQEYLHKNPWGEFEVTLSGDPDPHCQKVLTAMAARLSQATNAARIDCGGK